MTSGEVNLQADQSRDEWYLRCQLRIRPDDVRTVDIEKVKVLLNKYIAAGDGAMAYLCQSLLDFDGRRAAHVQADKCLLTGLVDGSVDSLQDGVFETLTPMFDVYVDDAEMMPLLNQAATKFGDAVQAEARNIKARFEADRCTQAGEPAPVQ